MSNNGDYNYNLFHDYQPHQTNQQHVQRNTLSNLDSSQGGNLAGVTGTTTGSTAGDDISQANRSQQHDTYLNLIPHEWAASPNSQAQQGYGHLHSTGVSKATSQAGHGTTTPSTASSIAANTSSRQMDTSSNYQHQSSAISSGQYNQSYPIPINQSNAQTLQQSKNTVQLMSRSTAASSAYPQGYDTNRTAAPPAHAQYHKHQSPTQVKQRTEPQAPGLITAESLYLQQEERYRQQREQQAKNQLQQQQAGLPQQQQQSQYQKTQIQAHQQPQPTQKQHVIYQTSQSHYQAPTIQQSKHAASASSSQPMAHPTLNPHDTNSYHMPETNIPESTNVIRRQRQNYQQVVPWSAKNSHPPTTELNRVPVQSPQVPTPPYANFAAPPQPSTTHHQPQQLIQPEMGLPKAPQRQPTKPFKPSPNQYAASPVPNPTLKNSAVAAATSSPAIAQPRTHLSTQNASSVYTPQAQNQPSLPSMKPQEQNVKAAAVAAIDKAEMEKNMLEMVERMRQYQALDPSVFQNVWENVKKVGDLTGSPRVGVTQDVEQRKNITGASSSQKFIAYPRQEPSVPSPVPGINTQGGLVTANPTSTPVNRKQQLPATQTRQRFNGHVSQANGINNPQKAPQRWSGNSNAQEGYGSRGTTGATGHQSTYIQGSGNQSDLQPGESERSLINTQLPSPSPTLQAEARSFSHGNQYTISRPVNSSPHEVTQSTLPQHTATSSITRNDEGHLWSESSKNVLAASAAKYVALTSNRQLSPVYVKSLLDKNPSFVELCEYLERAGYLFPRGGLAKELLNANPEIAGQQQPTISPPMPPTTDLNNSIVDFVQTADMQNLAEAQPISLEVDVNPSTVNEHQTSSISAPTPPAKRGRGRPKTEPSKPTRIPKTGASSQTQINASNITPYSLKSASIGCPLHYEEIKKQYVSPHLLWQEPPPRAPPLTELEPESVGLDSTERQSNPAPAITDLENEGLEITGWSAGKPSESKSTITPKSKAKAKTGMRKSKSKAGAMTDSISAQDSRPKSPRLSHLPATQEEDCFAMIPGTQTRRIPLPPNRSHVAPLPTFDSHLETTQDIPGRSVDKDAVTQGPPNPILVRSENPPAQSVQISPIEPRPAQAPTPLPLQQTPATQQSQNPPITIDLAKSYVNQSKKLEPPFDPVSIVTRIFKRKAARKSAYDPRTIARDVLLATGRHPNQPPLNQHLFILLETLSIDRHSDLETLRWDIIDPSPRLAELVGAEVGDEDIIMGDILPITQDDEVNLAVAALPAVTRRRGQPSKGGKSRASLGGLVGAAVAAHRSSGVDRGNRRASTGSTRTADTQNPSLGTSEISSNRPGDGFAIPARSVAGHVPTTSSALRNAFSPSENSPRRNSNAIAISSRSPSVVSTYESTQRAGRGKRKLDENGAPSVGKKKSPPRKPGAHPSSEYKVFKCKWQRCQAELHNLDTLQRHIFKTHKEAAMHGGYPCQWEGCQNPLEEQVQGFDTGEEWESHIVTDHISNIRNTMGSGPVVRPGGDRQNVDGYSSASEIEAVLSDSEGRRVTPFATPAPPGHVFTPPPGYAANRQFHMAHGLTTAEARRRSVHASAMERQRRLGAGMEAGATAVMNHIRMIIDLDDGQGILQEGRRTVPKVPDISRAEGKGRAL